MPTVPLLGKYTFGVNTVAVYVIREYGNPIYGDVYHCDGGSGYTNNLAEAKVFTTISAAEKYAGNPLPQGVIVEQVEDIGVE